MDVRRLAAAALVAAAVIGLAVGLLLRSSGGHSQTGTQTLAGGSFVTDYPPGWRLTVRRSPTGAARYQLSSTGAPISALGIPPAGTVGITIDEMPASALAKLRRAGPAPDTEAARQGPVELLPSVVGTPGRARGLERVASAHATSLAGVDAAEETYTYTYAGRGNVQVDVLSRRGGRIVLVELDAEPALVHASQAALETVTGRWRWH